MSLMMKMWPQPLLIHLLLIGQGLVLVRLGWQELSVRNPQRNQCLGWCNTTLWNERSLYQLHGGIRGWEVTAQNAVQATGGYRFQVHLTVGIVSAILCYSLLRLQKAYPFCSQIGPANVLIFLLSQKRSYKPDSNCQAGIWRHCWNTFGTAKIIKKV